MSTLKESESNNFWETKSIFNRQTFENVHFSMFPNQWAIWFWSCNNNLAVTFNSSRTQKVWRAFNKLEFLLAITSNLSSTLIFYLCSPKFPHVPLLESACKSINQSLHLSCNLGYDIHSVYNSFEFQEYSLVLLILP